MAEAVRGFLPVVINGVEGFITAGSVDDGLAVLTFARFGPTDAAGSTATTPAAMPIPVASHHSREGGAGCSFWPVSEASSIVAPGEVVLREAW